MQGYFFSQAKPAAEIIRNFLQPGMQGGGRIPTLQVKQVGAQGDPGRR
jgi:hypothetical protein